MNKWQLLHSDAALSTPWISVQRNQYRLAGGEILDDYYIVRRNDFVLVVARDRGKLVLVRQYRPATDQYYIGLPAGYVDSGESPEASARRELREETGYEAGDCRIIGALDCLPAYLKSRGFVAVCDNVCKKGELLDRAEIDEVFTLEWDAALRMIASGEINEMQAVCAILLAQQLMRG